MHTLFALAVPLALMLPITAGVDAPGERGLPQAPVSAPKCSASALSDVPLLANPLSAFQESANARQIRIEQRVMIRIAPQPLAARQSMVAELPQRVPAPKFEERDKEKCLPLDGIAGVQTGSGNRLVLFLRDQRMISLNLEKSCRARDFYSGFYVEKNKDGRLCVERDKLQSRTGARCEVEAMRQLVQVRD